MLYIPVILGSVRRGRLSARAAYFIIERMRQTRRIQPELLDLLEYEFPMLEERLRFRDDPPPLVGEFSEKLSRADSLVIVTPEYNNSFPGVLKNCLDYFKPEYRRKPIGIVTVSSADFGGVNCLAQLRLVTLAMGAFPIPASLPIPKAAERLREDGAPLDPLLEQRAQSFLDELIWFTEAIVAKKALDLSR
ncbi:MAG: NAD(P)H-dependent oxidoreductase [Blastocatellia bacterium AA13]|nr:MAG: NAD(P)H-dependent oxidoreductase [Blastocatellia bacterium AA13]